MAGNIKDLIVRILVDDDDVSKFQKAADKGLSMSNVMDGAALASTAVFAGLTAGAIIAGNAASDAEQAAGAVESVFAGNAAKVMDLASAAHDAVGLSTTDYSSLSSVLGSQLKNMGVANDQLVGQTDDLIGLGADLAATFGGSTSDAVSALSALLRGERDPIERYGVSIKEADVAAKAAELGLTDLYEAGDKGAATQATLALLAEQTASAHGQFAREADTAAGAQQRMQATVADATAELGGVFLPLMADAASILGDFAGWVKNNAGLVQGLAVGVGVLAGGVLLLSGAMKAMAFIQAVSAALGAFKVAQMGATVATAAQTVAQWANNAAWLASPVTWIIIAIIAAIGLLVAAGIWLYNNWDAVIAWFGEAWANVCAWFQSVGDGIAIWWNGLWAGIVGWFYDTFGPLIEWGMQVFAAFQLGIKLVGDGIATWWNGLWSGIGDFFSSIWDGFQSIVRNAWNGIVGWIEDGVNTAIDILNGFISVGNNVGGAFGFHINLIPHVSIPRLATGGITMGPTTAIVGDNPSGREAILPLDSPAARQMLGGSDEPVRLDAESITALARELARAMRNGMRDGGSVTA